MRASSFPPVATALACTCALWLGASEAARAAPVTAPSAAVAPAPTRVAPASARLFPGVAWLPAAADADIDRAFAQARAQNKPVLLYWGAAWCPPCNQLKATLFNRQDFITQSRAFVAVHVDGDRPGAQKLGTRFKVRGYPTMILLSPLGAEITRLPGEVDAPQVMAVLQLGLAGGRPVKDVLADARAGRALGANEWRLLAFYSWETDEQQLVPRAEVPGMLAQLAVQLSGASPPSTSSPGDADTVSRLWLKALAASDDGKGVKPDAGLRDRVRRILADPTQARTHMDVLTHGATDTVRVLSAEESPERMALVAAFDAALARFQADGSLSRADRVGALIARVDLARLDQGDDLTRPRLPAPLVSEVRELAASMDREITDGHERQAVVPAVAQLLGHAGLWTESDSLLKSNLAKSHSPYYLMSQLGSNARKLGHKLEALRWFEEAFNKSQGPATRLQWGASYLSALVELAPQDAARIERAARQLLAEAGNQTHAFHERNGRSLQRVGSKLREWNALSEHDDAIRRLQKQLAPLCRKLDASDAQRATCNSLLKGVGPAA